MKKLSESTALLYSQLQQQCATVLPIDKGISYSKKKISGKTYWYSELAVGGEKKEKSLGVDSEELRAQIKERRTLVEQAKDEVKSRQQLVGMLIKGGAASPTGTEARVLEVLEGAGVFLAGGVLVGSHAFSVYGNMLGVKWPTQIMKTQDMDVAGTQRIPVAAKRSDKTISDALQETGMVFFEVPALHPKNPSTANKIRGQEFSVDIITPMFGATSSRPVYLKNLKTFAEPLRFLDYLLEDTIPAVVVAKAGILINVPNPSRFVLHKLVVSVRRLAHEHNKAVKDRMQAQLLLDVLLDERPWEVQLAFQATKNMDNKFSTQLRQGIMLLDDKYKTPLLEMLDE